MRNIAWIGGFKHRSHNIEVGLWDYTYTSGVKIKARGLKETESVANSCPIPEWIIELIPWGSCHSTDSIAWRLQFATCSFYVVAAVQNG